MEQIARGAGVRLDGDRSCTGERDMLKRCWAATLVAGRGMGIASVPAVGSALLVLSLVLACGRESGDVAEDTTAVPGAGTVPTDGAPGDTAAPQGATWNLEMAEGQLREAGFAVNRDRTPVRLAFMSVPGTELDLGNSVTVQIYLYGDAAARGTDTDRLDPARAAPPTVAVPWRTPAMLVTDNNMAAIVLTGDPAARARISDALHRRADGDGARR
jgi:hypothetical protein